ncbi:MAG: hypothetical protein C0507_00440 [Cyanobacteria bacterium PR.3.49]|nr:hypothetical protein [Cyanobacteria bacterium PR.3.49]
MRQNRAIAHPGTVIPAIGKLQNPCLHSILQSSQSGPEIGAGAETPAHLARAIDSKQFAQRDEHKQKIHKSPLRLQSNKNSKQLAQHSYNTQGARRKRQRLVTLAHTQKISPVFRNCSVRRR